MGVFYASIIWNIFVNYSVCRFFFVRLQNFFINRYNNIVSKGAQTSAWLSSLVSIINCTPNFSTSLLFYPLSYILFGALMMISHDMCERYALCGAYNLGNGLSHLSFFIGGVLVAHVYECIFKTTFYPTVQPRRAQPAPSSYRRLNPIFRLILRILFLPFIDFSDADNEDSDAVGSFLENSIIWRFLPDALLVLCFFVMFQGFEGIESSPAYEAAFTYLVSTYTVMSFILVSLLQLGRARSNLSRFILESPFLNVIGKASYPICKHNFCSACSISIVSTCSGTNLPCFVDILQTVFFNFYIKIYYDAVHSGYFHFTHDELYRYMWESPFRNWFRKQSYPFVIGGFGTIIVIGWLIQVFFQEKLVASLVSRFMRAKALLLAQGGK